jgi:hypothetical protein
VTFVKGNPKPPTSGRKKKTPIRRAGDLTPAIEHLAQVIVSADPAITPELKVRAAVGLAPYQNPKPTAPRQETFIGPIDYTKPSTVEGARETILALGERLARREISVEAHDALVNGLRTYLADRAADQQRELDRLKADLGSGE